MNEQYSPTEEFVKTLAEKLGILGFMTPPPFMLDVTETLSSGRRTGIQRVSVELARELLRRKRGKLIRLCFKTQRFVTLTDDETASLFEAAPRATQDSTWQRRAARWGLTPLLGFLKDGWLALSLLKRRGPALPWGSGIYLTAEVLGNLVRFDAVRRLQASTPTVLMFHDILPLTDSRYSALRRRAFDRHWSLALHATNVVSVSDYTRKEALAFAAANQQILPSLKVSYPGHSLGAIEEAAPTPLPQQEYFLCVGTLEYRKNQERLLKVYERYRRAGGKAGLVFVGSPGPGSDRLTRAIERASSQQVLWFRQADDPSLKWLYRRAQVLVYPSLAEGFGLPLVEALALGTPCITSNRTSTVEVAKLCGGCLVVDPEDDDALLDALLRTDQRVFRDTLVETIRSEMIPRWEAFADVVLEMEKR